MASANSTTQQNLTTLQGYLLSRKPIHEGEGDLIGVISKIALAGKAIAAKVKRARIEDIIGSTHDINVQGEKQEKLDVLSNDIMMRCLAEHPNVAVCASEEEPDSVVVRPRSAGGEFVVLFDPLDGSSNIDVAAGVGTIFSILPNTLDDDDTARSALQPGSKQLAAGYVLYGSSVLMVLSTGDGVDMFVLDPSLGEFLLVKEKLQVPVEMKVRSLNGAYRGDFPEGYRNYLEFTERNSYASRYIGSMVADVHRTLLKGGVFIYPPTAKNPKGKLRLLYEANPMAFLVEQGGGSAGTGTGRILEVEPTELHERTPVILGSANEVQHVVDHIR